MRRMELRARNSLLGPLNLDLEQFTVSRRNIKTGVSSNRHNVVCANLTKQLTSDMKQSARVLHCAVSVADSLIYMLH